jgi:hypothetical protein
MKSLVFSGLTALLIASFGPLSAAAEAQVFSSQRRQPQPAQGSAQNTPAQNTPQNTPQNTSPNNNRGTVAMQTVLDADETLYLNRKDTYDYDLILRSTTDINGQRFPIGSIVRGQFEPAEGGLVYRASSVEVGDRIYNFSAYSDLLRDRKDPRQTSTGAIVTDAAIGAAGGYVLGEVLGRADVWEVVGGAAAGVVVGNTTAPFVVVIDPEDPIMLYAN